MKEIIPAQRSRSSSVNWIELIACRDADPEIFFRDSRSKEAVKPALDFCNSCPVVKECLKDGLEDEYGIRGGKTGPERRAIVQSNKDLAIYALKRATELTA